jgi:hypothetical protein
MGDAPNRLKSNEIVAPRSTNTDHPDLMGELSMDFTIDEANTDSAIKRLTMGWNSLARASPERHGDLSAAFLFVFACGTVSVQPPASSRACR